MLVFRSGRLLAASALAVTLISGCTTGNMTRGGSAAQAAAAAVNNPAAPESAYAPLGYASPSVTSLITKYAGIYEVPEGLVHRMVKRESGYNPAARNGAFWGLMQIRHDTARTMGYQGPANGLLDPETNLKYAVKYLRGAYLVADGNQDRAVSLYSRGYYYDAKRKGLLKATGLRP